MAALILNDFSLPKEMAEGIFKKAQTGSVISKLSGARPQKFGKQSVMVLSGAPKAEIVGEGATKSPTPTTYTTKTVTPLKLQVTMRFSQEVMWADEDAQIGVLQDLSENAGIALGRALDLVAIHKLNPLAGTVSSLVTSGLIDTTKSATLANGKYDAAIETAVGLVIDAGFTPTGLAMDPALSFGLSTMRDTTGRRLYPELGFGQAVSNFEGVNAAVSTTVSAAGEASAASNLLGIVGQFDAVRWGVQRNIAAHLIEYGDPDGLGDLQRKNQLAIRAEVVYGIGILDLNAFAKILKPTSGA